MNWYIDFDSTLYDTSSLVNDMFEAISEHIHNEKSVDKKQILNELNSLFNRENIYNIFKLCEYFENKYKLQANCLSKEITHILENGSKYVYADCIPFLKEIADDNLTILTNVFGSDNINFQNLKINGSGLAKYFDSIIVSAKPKYELNLKYENGIFIDDSPKNLQKLYDAQILAGGTPHVIRIRRESAKSSKENLNNPNIKEYSTFTEILFKEENIERN